jgi:hypothetical protein
MCDFKWIECCVTKRTHQFNIKYLICITCAVNKINHTKIFPANNLLHHYRNGFKIFKKEETQHFKSWESINIWDNLLFGIRTKQWTTDTTGFRVFNSRIRIVYENNMLSIYKYNSYRQITWCTIT